jgi:uncharacterized protein (DUF4415 family)
VRLQLAVDADVLPVIWAMQISQSRPPVQAIRCPVAERATEAVVAGPPFSCSTFYVGVAVRSSLPRLPSSVSLPGPPKTKSPPLNPLIRSLPSFPCRSLFVFLTKKQAARLRWEGRLSPPEEDLSCHPVLPATVPPIGGLWYDQTKRKISVSLDEDLVTELEAGGEALSGQVNEAVRVEIQRRQRHRLLIEFLDAMDAEHGPVDERLVAKYVQLLE